MCEQSINGLSKFLKNSPTAFHAVDTMSKMLKNEGYTYLSETDAWEIVPGGKYYTTRNQSSLIAFSVSENLEDYSFRITASHSDSPTFKIKENAELLVQKHYAKLNTEGYGGMLCSTWFDRPLSIAGRVLIQSGDSIEARLIKIDRDLCIIPSLAIHMDRNANDGHTFNKQVDMLPLIGGEAFAEGAINELIADELGLEANQIVGRDLYLYNRMEPTVWGANREYFSAAQLDDLQCAYATLTGFIEAVPKAGVNVFACFDNEEVGSGTKQGASSTFLSDALKRLNTALGKTEEDYLKAVAQSFMVSCDNAHAVHPNYPDKTDQNNCAYLNEGIVIKSHAGQKYTSDGVSVALFKAICKRAEVPVQFFANRSDMAGGSTLGNLAMTQVSLNAVDIGLPQLAMHSSYETSGVKDTQYLIDACRVLYSIKITSNGEGRYEIL